MSRIMHITTPLGENVLRFHSMNAHEELGRPFDYQITVLSEKNDVDPDKLLGQPISVSLDLPEQETRYFHAYVSRVAQVGMIGRFHAYLLAAHPWSWFLSRVSDCRIFQNMTVPEIIKDVLSKYQDLAVYEDKLTARYVKWEYCVQYRESTLNFINRLMEQEGIYYYFKHEKDKHTMVLVDAKSRHTPYPGYEKITYLEPKEVVTEEEHVQAWNFAREVQPVTYATKDFDFKRPSLPLKVSKQVRRQHAHASYEVFDYPGEYVDKQEGEHYAQARIDEIHSRFELANGVSNARGLCVGHLFTLTKHPRRDQNKEYLLVSADYQLHGAEHETSGSGGASFACSFNVLASQQQFRPQRLTPKPIVQGPQTAMVVGPSGDEIHTDEYGRVKVQFHWDRYGKSDAKSSCWIRVSQPWAGKNWGGISIPRIGQEVIVDFLEGDPDLPIITGRVYNQESMPPFGLPAAAVVSGLKTQTHKGKGFNEMSMDDTAGKEKINIHGQYDMATTVQHDQTNTINNNRSTTVVVNDTLNVNANRTVTVKGKQTETIVSGAERTVSAGLKDTISGGATSTITGGMSSTISGGATSTVNGGATTNINGKSDTTVTGHATETITAGEEQTVTAGKKLTVSGGFEELVTGARMIGITGPMTQSSSGPMDLSTAATGTYTAAASLTMAVGGSVIEITPGAIVITAGGSTIKVDAGGVSLNGAKISLN